MKNYNNESAKCFIIRKNFIIIKTSFNLKLEMWAVSDALPHEAEQAPSPSACQVSAMHGRVIAILLFSPRGSLKSTTDLGEGW